MGMLYGVFGQTRNGCSTVRVKKQPYPGHPHPTNDSDLRCCSASVNP